MSRNIEELIEKEISDTNILRVLLMKKFVNWITNIYIIKFLNY